MTVAEQLRDAVRPFLPSPLTRMLRRAALWKRRTAFHPYVLTRTVNEDSYRFYIADETARRWYGRPNVASPEFAFVQSMISPSDLAFDVGSHHGFYALVMARGAKRVIAIEPSPYNVVLLKKNLELN